MRGLQYTAKLLAPLKGLSSLQTLLLATWYGSASKHSEEVHHVDGRLGPRVAEAQNLLPHLTELQQLTCLAFTRTERLGEVEQDVWLIARVSVALLWLPRAFLIFAFLPYLWLPSLSLVPSVVVQYWA
jgi:hypothetical protein